jgi:hypothetical protein
MKRIVRFIFGYVILLAVSLAYLIPSIPKTRLGWIVLIILAPPGYLLGEWLGGKFSGSWGEGTFLRKAVKATILVIVTLMAMIIAVVFRA